MTATENLSPGAGGGSTVRRRICVAVSAGIPASLYLLYVFHYALDMLHYDDWGVVNLVHSAIHGRLTMSALWRQYGDTRPFVARLFFVAFGLHDHLNEKSIMLFSAVILIAGFVLLLFLFRSYLGRRLTFLPVLSLGVVWFSLADVQSALWSFQLTWYLAVFFLVAAVYLLLVPRHGRNLFFALAVAAAVAGSLSFLQGFLVWPIGLICLLWVGVRGRRTYYETTIWVSAAVITTATYLRGYDFANPACTAAGGPKGACSLTYGLQHPDRVARFFVLLVGNVVPTAIWGIRPRYLRAQEVLGLVICIVAGFVVVQSIRERPRQANPLPLLLIVFAVLCDVMIATAHVGLGISAAGINRFTMPNLLLLVGIVVYAWGHVPSLRRAQRPFSGRGWLRVLAFGTLIAFLVAQCVLTTTFGITSGRTIRAKRTIAARVAGNWDQIPPRNELAIDTGVSNPGTPLAFPKRARVRLLPHPEHHATTEGKPQKPPPNPPTPRVRPGGGGRDLFPKDRRPPPPNQPVA